MQGEFVVKNARFSDLVPLNLLVVIEIHLLSPPHIRYEIAPFIPTAVGLVCVLVRGPKRAPPAALNTVQHHDMHHRFPNKHFSLYFTHLDRLVLIPRQSHSPIESCDMIHRAICVCASRWCGTLHSNYDARVQEHFGKHK